MKKITITLDDYAEKYFNEVAYGLEGKRGEANNSEVINHCLTELAMFEKFTEDQLTNWLHTNYPVLYAQWHKEHYPEQYRELTQEEFRKLHNGDFINK